MPDALRPDIAATSETLTGLRVVKTRVGGVDGVFGFGVATLGRMPVFIQPGPNPPVTVQGHALRTAQSSPSSWSCEWSR